MVLCPRVKGRDDVAVLVDAMIIKTVEYTSVMMTAVPLWALSLPLPAIILISVGLYMLFLAGVLWCHHCLKTQCDPQCTSCCPSVSPFEYCHICAQSCDCRPPSLHTCLDRSCPASNCAMWDCTCTPQPPQCDSINCLCCEIKFK